MDIERIQKLINNKMEAGNKVKEVRKVIENYVAQKEDQQLSLMDTLEPYTKYKKAIKEETKKATDERQDELIKQLKENQLALKGDIGNLSEAIDRTTIFEKELPNYIEEHQAIEGPPVAKVYNFDFDSEFTSGNLNSLKEEGLTAPSEVFKSAIEDGSNLDVYYETIGKKK